MRRRALAATATDDDRQVPTLGRKQMSDERFIVVLHTLQHYALIFYIHRFVILTPSFRSLFGTFHSTKLQKTSFFRKKKQESFAVSKKVPTFASAFEKQISVTRYGKQKDGAIVYRLGREIFILKSGVRFPVALQS